MSHPAAGGRTEPDRLFTISNLLSISRGILAIPFVLVMLSGSSSSTLWGVIIMVVAAFTDKLDGELARRLHQTTEWGKILDPVADKIAVAAVTLVLVKLQRISPWFLIGILARDILILAGGWYLKSAKGILLSSNETGKWAVSVIALTLLVSLLQAGSPWVEILMAASIGFMLVSVVQYSMRFVRAIRV